MCISYRVCKFETWRSLQTFFGVAGAPLSDSCAVAKNVSSDQTTQCTPVPVLMVQSSLGLSGQNTRKEGIHVCQLIRNTQRMASLFMLSIAYRHYIVSAVIFRATTSSQWCMLQPEQTLDDCTKLTDPSQHNDSYCQSSWHLSSMRRLKETVPTRTQYLTSINLFKIVYSGTKQYDEVWIVTV